MTEEPGTWERKELFNIIPAPVGLDEIISSAICNKIPPGEEDKARKMCHPEV